MCGIAGIISSDPDRFNTAIVQKMTMALSHRGPDGDSIWTNPSQQVLFGHRRLSIIDLSENGRQAMHYQSRYTIIYNGEIYNYLEIKGDLQKKGYSFQTLSDTEVILAAYECYQEQCLQLFDGMFSFSIWDEQQQTLFAARDRFGEKPFYYFHDTVGNILWFASEIKALSAAGIGISVNNRQLSMYLSLGYPDDPSDPETTFYNNIKQLPAANFLLYDLPGRKLTTHQYWKLDKEKQITISEPRAFETFNDLFKVSIARRLRSDVPLGTSLSGGLDSSAVTAMIHNQTNSAGRKTFSSVFPGFIKDESLHIERVATAFKLENYAVTPTPEEFTRDFEKLLYHHESPISSASVYLQYRVFELAKQHDVKVLLDGQGADEILGGYTKYIHLYLQELIHQNKFSEFQIEKKALRSNQMPFNWTWKNYVAAKFTHLSKTRLEKRESDAIKRNSDLVPDFFRQNLNGNTISKPHVSKLNDILYFNTCLSGLQELLRYADRNSMAHGREVRLPFLSHELVEFIFSLPSHFKIHDGWTKWILRKTVEKKLPRETVWRKDKIGFEPPQKSWMEHILVRDYLHESKKKLVDKKILKASVLSKKNQPHEAYAADNLDWRYLVAGQLLK
ncbi:MAG: asparagine synthase (glutamine-hydrolyzing) [Chitinophagaceae bacterium]|nr:asparagine synthase (glutamine-hydrolyzing) [Chitinophagaceae bacterium]